MSIISTPSMVRLFFDAAKIEYISEQLDVFCPQFCVEKNGVGCMEFDSADWRLTEELNRLAERGLDLWGWVYPADDQLGCRFVTHDRWLITWETVNNELVVRVHESGGTLDLDSANESLDAVRWFFEIKQEVKRLLPEFDPYAECDAQQADEEAAAAQIIALEFQAAGFTEVPDYFDTADEPEEPSPEPHDKLGMECGTSLDQCHDEDCTEYDHHPSEEDLCSDCATERDLNAYDQLAEERAVRLSQKVESILAQYEQEQARQTTQMLDLLDFQDTLPIHL
ncbi:MAG: hypothetical protein HYZ50_20295 [Deltaproteobacteria bacterium]|nr:hypothetical protein [Deltaproteobacteria bacterium]